MHPNFLFIPMLLGTFALGIVGFKVAQKLRSTSQRAVCWLAALILALPALLFVVYYGHGLDSAAWFYDFRAAPYTELTASGLGFGLGLALGFLRGRSTPQKALVGRMFAALPVLCVLLFGSTVLAVPYIKPVIAPLKVPLQTRWSQNVCLQSTPSTCGPCSAATLLRQFHIEVTERELAQECFSYGGGTENWYVARALQRHGLHTRYVVTSPQPATLPEHSIAGVNFGGPGRGGHFITILGHEGKNIVVGDPLVGKLVLSPEQVHSRYYFTGFFLVVSQ